MNTEKNILGVKYALHQYYNSTFTHKRIQQNLMLNKNMKILDFGSGMGGNACWISKYVQSVTGFEIDEYYLKVSNSVKNLFKYTNIEFLNFNILQNKSDKTFDIIMLNDVIEHLPKDSVKPILKELKKYLNDNGKVYIQFPPWNSPWAAHTNHILPNVPWIQYLPAKLRNKLINKYDKELIGHRESTSIAVYNGLNHITAEQLIQYTNELNYNIEYRYSHSKFSKFVKLFPIVFKYFITVEVFILSKK